MNKKEVAEIKKNFALENGFFTIERILTAFVDAEDNILYSKLQNAYSIPDVDISVYEETLKKVLNTNVGKNFIEYNFPHEAYEEDKPQNILYNLIETEMNDEYSTDIFIKHIVDNAVYIGPYTIITAYCTYSVRHKNMNDDIDDDLSDEVYKFIITAICPVDTSNNGFIFNKDDNEIEKALNTELIINKSPVDGFLFPVFNNRSADINSVMYYTKNKSKPNISFVENVLGCPYTMSADNELASFQNIIKAVVDEDLTYSTFNNINEHIKAIIEDNKDDTEATTINAQTIENILNDVGVDDKRLSLVKPVYEKVCGEDIELTATNLVEKKTVINSGAIKVDVKPNALDKVHTSVINGRRCIVIDIDDPMVEVNGLPVNL